MMRSRVATWVAVALLGTGLGTLGCKASSSEAAPPAKKLRVTFTMHLAYGPLLLAQEAGYFAQEGLDVELVHLPRGEESLIALLGGDIDAIASTLHPGLFSAMAKGGAVRMVAGMNYLARDGCTYMAMVLRPGLTAAQALRRIGRIEASRDGGSRYLTERMLATQGIALDTLDVVNLPPPVIEHSLETKSIDVAAVTEPVLTRVARRSTVWLRAQDATPDYQWGAISFGERLLQREPETGRRFLVAYRRGIELFNEGKTPRNLELLQRATQEDRAILEGACWPAFRADARVNLRSVQEYLKWAFDRKLLDQIATPQQLWDSSYVVGSDSGLARYRALQPQEH